MKKTELEAMLKVQEKKKALEKNLVNTQNQIVKTKEKLTKLKGKEQYLLRVTKILGERIGDLKDGQLEFKIGDK